MQDKNKYITKEIKKNKHPNNYGNGKKISSFSVIVLVMFI